MGRTLNNGDSPWIVSFLVSQVEETWAVTFSFDPVDEDKSCWESTGFHQDCFSWNVWQTLRSAGCIRCMASIRQFHSLEAVGHTGRWSLDAGTLIHPRDGDLSC